MTENTLKTIILGAGLAGLSAAYHGGFPVYETRQRPGGTADSIKKNGFVFDYGIHVLQSKDPRFYGFLDQLDLKLITHKRSGWIYNDNRYFPYPFQVNTSHLPLFHRLRCIVGYLMRRNSSKPENYEEWMIQNFGKGFSKTFLIPYSKKFWRVSPKEMTYEWAGYRVPRPRLLEVIKGAFKDQETNLGTHVEFHYPANKRAGFAAIAQSMASKIDSVHYGMNATAIDPYKKVVFFNDGKISVPFDNLITTIPLPELIRLLPSPSAKVQNKVSRLRFNSIAIVNLGVDRPQITDKHWVHFPDKAISFFRISFPSNLCDGLSPPGSRSIQAEISYDAKKPPNKDDILHQVKTDLIKVGILKAEDQFMVQEVRYQPYGYVIYDHYRKDAVAGVHKYFMNFDIYPCGRYGAWEYFWSDQAILSGRITAEQVLQKTGHYHAAV
jgi:UDP-galactopyranose mutase